MKRNLISYLKFNRYAYHIYDDARDMNGIKKIIFIMKMAFTSCIKHGIFLNDYYKEIDKNNDIIELRDYGVKFYIPYYKYDCIQSTIARDDDFFSINDLKYLKDKWIKPGSDILDIGANIGNHTIFFARECLANSVISFEPQDDIFRILQKNVKLNGLQAVCKLYNYALGGETGNAEIRNYNPNNTGGTSIRMDKQGGINVKRLDDFEFKNIDFMKVDVEGFEYNVFCGAKVTLEKHKPVIFVEIEKENFERVNKLLRGYDYILESKVSDEDFIYVPKI